MANGGNGNGSKTKRKQKPDHLWKKGESGNPNGRPRDSIARRLREAADKVAQETGAIDFFDWLAREALTKDNQTALSILSQKALPNPPADLNINHTMDPTEDQLERIREAREEAAREIERRDRVDPKAWRRDALLEGVN